MRRLSTIVLVAAAAITVTAFTGGSAYAGETATARFVSPAPVVTPSALYHMDDQTTGCRSHREGITSQSESIKR